MAYRHIVTTALFLISLFFATEALAASSSGTTIPSASQIVDASGAVWTVSGGVIYKNGSLAGYSNAVAELAYVNGVIYQENASQSWWSWNGSGWVDAGNPTAGTTVSANGTSITSNGQIVDSHGAVWTLSNGLIYINGSAAGYSNGVVNLVYSNGVVYQENNAHGWWSWNGSGWVTANSPVASANGACGVSNGAALTAVPTTNLCTSGAASPVGGSGPWYWNCASSTGGTTANCEATVQTVNGACGTSNGASFSTTPSANLCSAGTLGGFAGNGPWYWNCAGSHGGTTENCGANLTKAQATNGVCGASNGATLSSTPTANLCSSGTAGGVTGSGPWGWTCSGADGGTNATCAAAVVVNKTSPDGTSITSSGQIVDSMGAVWTLSGGVIYKNGSLAGYSNGVVDLVYSKGVIYQENNAQGWWSWNGSTWADATSPIVGTNGVCGASNGVSVSKAPTANLCSTGSASGISGSGPWAWSCAGTNGGTNASCAAPLQPVAVNGVCGTSNGVSASNAPTANLCSTGSASGISGNGPWAWSCAGSNGGTNATCSAPLQPIAVNGTCGNTNSVSTSTAPTANLCSTGTASGVNGNGPWAWSCTGSNGGTNSNCSASLQSVAVNGVCGASSGATFSSAPTSGLCGTGAASGITGSGPWAWSCAGSNGGANASCSAALTQQPTNADAICGSASGASFTTAPTSNLCSSGFVPNNVVQGSGPWGWTCLSSAGGKSVNCSANLKVGVDTSAPTIPASLTATPSSHSQINLYWAQSTDNVGVTGYAVYRNGSQIGTSASTSYSDTQLVASTTYTYAVSAFDAAGNHSTASAAVSATTESSNATAGSKLGVNLDFVSDWGDRATMFVDVMKIARGFAAPDHYWDPGNFPVPVDSNGWPTTDFGVMFISNGADPLNRPLTETFPSMFGTYHLSFNGQATVTSADCCVVQNTAYDADTNTTTADVVVGPTDQQVSLRFLNTSGVQNLKLLRPGYAIGTTQVFTTQFLNALAPFSTMRFMNSLMTNNNIVTSWDQRPSASNPIQTTANGIAWEYVIALANATGKDIWINIPWGVDLTDQTPNNYVTQLAQLLKANLNPGINVYVEYSNEVWNGVFGQFQNNVNAAVNEVNSGADPTLNFDNGGNQYYWAYRRTAHQIVRISQLFANVYGQAAINTTIRPVLMSQYVQPYIAEDSLIYINSNFGAPNKYLYGVGGAPYETPANNYWDIDTLFTQMETEMNQYILPGYLGIQQYNGVVNWGLPQPSYKRLADYYGLKSLAYEGGLNLGDGPNPTLPANEQSRNDPRSNMLIQDNLSDWFGCGNDLFMYFELATAPGNQYGLYTDTAVATPKSLAAATISATPLANYNTCASALNF